jgi:hypothetical protein
MHQQNFALVPLSETHLSALHLHLSTMGVRPAARVLAFPIANIVNLDVSIVVNNDAECGCLTRYPSLLIACQPEQERPHLGSLPDPYPGNYFFHPSSR